MGSGKETTNLAKKPKLLILPFSSHIVFPCTYCWMAVSEKLFNRHIIERVLQTNPPECLIVVQNLNLAENDPKRFSNIGVVVNVKVEGSKINFFAQYRAGIEEPEYDPKRRSWSANALKLPDVPELQELSDSHSDLSMILGCVESIFILLQDLAPLIKDKQLAQKIKDLLSNLKFARREKERAYSLPWHVLIDFRHLPDRVQSSMLAADSILERLQIVVDILKLEKQILRNAEVFAEEEPYGPGINNGK